MTALKPSHAPPVPIFCRDFFDPGNGYWCIVRCDIIHENILIFGVGQKDLTSKLS